MQLIRKFTTPAHWPRSDSREVSYRDAKLDISYSVHSQNLPQGPPSATKFNLVFSHGAQYCKEGWYYWINKCFEIFGDKLDKCIAFDHVHHGESALLNKGKLGFYIPWDEMGRDVGMVIRNCIERGEISHSAPTIVIGHSMGGIATMTVSVMEPSLVSAIVVIDPVWMGPMFPHDSAGAMSGKFIRMAHSSWKRTRDTFKDLDDYFDYMNNKSLYAKIHPDIKRDIINNLWVALGDGTIRNKMSRTNQSASYYAGMSAVGFAESLVKRIRLPVLILHGDVYDFNPEGLQEALKDSLADSELKVIEGEGHMVCYTQPDKCIDAVKDYILKQADARIKHVKEVDQNWGLTAEQSFLKEVEKRAKGNREPGFSKL